MAAPHIAGVAALLRQQHPDADQSVIKSIIMGSTVPAQNPAGAPIPITLQGTGVIRADLAARATAYADPGCISFGRLNPTANRSQHRHTFVYNLELQRGRVMQVRHVPNQTLPGVKVVCRQKTLNFGMRGRRAALNIRVIMDPAEMPPDLSYFSHTEIDGWCMVSDGLDEVAVAYTATVDPASHLRSWERRPGEGRVANLGQTFGYGEIFNVADGSSPAIEQFGWRTEDYGFPALEFGLALREPWETMSNLDILISIDADEDGIYETLLEAADLGLLTGGDPTGEIVTVIFNEFGGFITPFDVFGDFNDGVATLMFCENDCFGAPIGVLPEGDTTFDYLLEVIDVRTGECAIPPPDPGDAPGDPGDVDGDLICAQRGSIDLAADGNAAPSYVVVAPGEREKIFYAPGAELMLLAPTNKVEQQVRYFR
jgi:hypothetical protein